MAIDKIITSSIADDAVGNTKLDLSENYAFTGTVTGAGKVLKITTSAYESVTSTSGSTFVDVTTITHIDRLLCR